MKAVEMKIQPEKISVSKIQNVTRNFMDTTAWKDKITAWLSSKRYSR